MADETEAGSATSSAPASSKKDSDIKVPQDLSRVSNAKARELAEAGLVEDRELPGKMYRRKIDGFVTKIPNYTYEAYDIALKDEWEEIKLTTEAEASEGDAKA